MIWHLSVTWYNFSREQEQKHIEYSTTGNYIQCCPENGTQGLKQIVFKNLILSSTLKLNLEFKLRIKIHEEPNQFNCFE